jgi:hypothetical protein
VPSGYPCITGQDLTDLVLSLTPAAAVRGQVSGVSAAELATAKVSATDFGVDRFHQMFSPTVDVSGISGCFRHPSVDLD